MRKTVLAGICGLVLMTAGSGAALAAGAAPLKAAAQADQHWGMLNTYCTDCHNFEDWAGGVAFDTMSPDGVPQNAKVWEEAVRKLRGRMMPPPGRKRPGDKEIDGFVDWMQTYLDQAAARYQHPGFVPLHRLNRKEYANAVKTLLDVDVKPAAILPEDNVSEGFDNIAAALQVSPSFMEQYVSAARMVVELAIGKPDPAPSSQTYRAVNAGSQEEHIEGLPLGTRGGILAKHLFPADGDYVLNIANMAQALWVYNMEFKNHLIVTLDGKKIYETSIGGEADMKAIDQDQDPAVDAINKRLKDIHFNATAGVHEVGVAFIRRTFAESDDRLQALVPGGQQDRVLRVSSFEISGPFHPTGLSMTQSRKRVFICYPHETAAEDACARKILANFAEKAYRRPVTDADMAVLWQFYQKGYKTGGFEQGVRMGLTRVLASPNFLYRVEPVPAAAKPGDVLKVDDLSLASRLSYFLWSDLPDKELLDLAKAHKLSDKAVLEAQVKRMLADPRSKALATNFAYQWLELAKLNEVEPDRKVFPYASGAGDPRADYKTEIEMFVDSIFRENHNVTDFLTARYTFLNEKLALQYGINSVKGTRFRRVDISDHPERWGLLGKGGILMAFSYPNRTAPVLRGEWILDNVVGTPPASPPPNVANLKENIAGAKEVLTVRERMAQHRTDPSCNSCHGILDPLGLALENFDATGRWRTKDRFSGAKIDAAGELPDGTTFTGPNDLRAALMRRPEQFVQTLTEKLMTYALGRKLEYYDMPTVRRIVATIAKQDYRFVPMVMNIVESDEFRMKQLPKDTEAPLQEAALQNN